MDQVQGPSKSNIARPLSRLPMARASSIPTSSSDPSKMNHLPRASISNSKKPVVRPLGESNNLPSKPSSFGWSSKIGAGIISSLLASPQETVSPVDINEVPFPVPSGNNENVGVKSIDSSDETNKPERRKPRLSLSERTVETLCQVSPAPSPTRRRSSTVKSNGSMGPPARPASSMRDRRPSTPSNQTAISVSSPVKKHFRPPGKPTTPARERNIPVPTDTIYTPPKVFMRDHSSRIGRPARNDRRSISTNITEEAKTSTRPVHHAARVKSMYDIRGANNSLQSKPSLPTLRKDPATPQTMSRKSSFQDTSPHTGLMKARSPGENVLAPPPKPTILPNKATSSTKKPRRNPAKQSPKAKEPLQDVATMNPSKSSAALRDTIAKAKAAKKEQLRKSVVEGDMNEEKPAIINLGAQSLGKKLQQAVTSGTLNLAAMSLKTLPEQIMHMYDFSENSELSWAEAVDLTKLILADNELDNLPESAFPDWSEEEMMADTEKSNQFGGLETLDLHGNALSSLPFGIRRLGRLQTLNLSGNNLNITVFSIISELQSLRELRLSKNGLHGDLPSQSFNMINLQILDLSNNQLDVLPASIANLTSLQKLILGNNRFTSLPLQVIPAGNLIELDLSNNALGKSFDTEGLRAFQKLQVLNLSCNHIECLNTNFFDLPVLQRLELQNNRIDTLPDMTRCVELTALIVSDNRLTTIPEGFYSLSRLRNVDFSGNNIRTIGTEISNMDNIVTLNLAGNPLREKKYLTMNVQDLKTDMIRKAGPLETAVANVEAVTKSSSEEATSERLIIPKGGVLDASSCGLSSLQPDQVDLTKPVHTMRLANNDFTALPVELLMHPSIKWSLKSLDMSHNPNLHSVDYLNTEIHLPLLQSLYIVSTGLTTLETLTTYLKAPELRELNISCHRLAGHLPWVRAWYPTVTTLLASDNWFDSIDVEAVRGLEVLDVRSNEIDSLPAKIGLLGNRSGKSVPGKLRSFECSGNRFRIPRQTVVEKGTEAVLKDLRRMIPSGDVPDEWLGEV